MHKSEHIITTKHYLVMSALAFCSGIALSCTVSAERLFVISLLLSVVLVVLSVAVILKHNVRKGRIKHLLLPFFLVFCTLLGMFRIAMAEYIFPNSLKEYVGQELWLSGTISSPVTKTANGYSHQFNLEVIQANDKYISPETIVVYIPESRGRLLAEGDEICCWAKLTYPARKDEADAFDYYTHLRSRNIFCIGTTANANKITLDKPFHPITFIKDIGNFIKNKVVTATDSIVFDDVSRAAVLKGILVGDKSAFSDELYVKFSNAGLSHIVAVSGMHLSILFTVLTLLFSKTKTNKKVTYLISIPIIVLFVAAAQFTPSVCRSAVMMLVMIFAMLTHQRYTPINALFFSLITITAFAPYTVFSKSLILSFGATLGILVYFGYLYTFLKDIIPVPKTNKVAICCKEAFCSSIPLSLSSFIGTVYFSALFYGRISWIQFFTNLWIIPIVTLTFCTGFLACSLYCIMPNIATAIFYYPLKICLRIIISTAEFFGKDCFSIKVNSENIPPITFLIYIGTALIIYLILKFINDLKHKEPSISK